MKTSPHLARHPRRLKARWPLAAGRDGALLRMSLALAHHRRDDVMARFKVPSS
jgi:hypothetical protein